MGSMFSIFSCKISEHQIIFCYQGFSLTLNEVENQLSDLGKPLGSMNLDELLKNVWTAAASHSSWMDPNNASPASSLQLQASLSLARAFNGKTVDEVWKDIQGHTIRNEEETSSKEREPTLGETTLEDFLVKAGLYVADASLGPVTGLQNAICQYPWRKRHSGDPQKNFDRRLKRKIKNRESAARSRARKQAYHNELVSRVSFLEEANAKLRKEKANFRDEGEGLDELPAILLYSISLLLY
ncbi:ABSCISIC ACID-INSENSITIVE 5-like protein 2 [Abeliophyllum distichum]|uniref:ABSCISIC ACID-INSENSITIVE 5-like protein 2 n=1 Tax=Abeliophyllum distichum TaxID=126358 RepID=A0ABD1VU85_9LAMI